eukprot:m.77410 g.77410  ORF g.77410 m.77410 type:complete len:588 (-) comp12508_c0_seq2:658-2421(-)
MSSLPIRSPLGSPERSISSPSPSPRADIFETLSQTHAETARLLSEQSTRLVSPRRRRQSSLSEGRSSPDRTSSPVFLSRQRSNTQPEIYVPLKLRPPQQARSRSSSLSTSRSSSPQRQRASSAAAETNSAVALAAAMAAQSLRAGPPEAVAMVAPSPMLTDSTPLEAGGALFDGQPNSKDTRPAQTKHSYTPQSRQLPKTPQSPEGPDSTGQPARSLPKTPRTASVERARQDIVTGRAIITNFLQEHNCYDIMPLSGKIVVFDTQLHVKKALMALVKHNIRSAPLWNSRRQQFVGMITVTDFINILIQTHDSTESERHLSELETHRIQKWRDLSRGGRPDSLVCIDPMLCLKDAVKFLIEKRIHRLPVIDSHTGNALSILTHKRLLHIIFINVIQGERALPMLDAKLGAIKLGTYNSIQTIKVTTPVIEALRLFKRYRVSALPIVDDHNVVVDIYAKHDVQNLARDKTYYHLEMTVQEALQYRASNFSGVQTCTMNYTLRQIIELLVSASIHRLVVVNEQKQLLGILSLSDILSYLVSFSSPHPSTQPSAPISTPESPTSATSATSSTAGLGLQPRNLPTTSSSTVV